MEYHNGDPRYALYVDHSQGFKLTCSDRTVGFEAFAKEAGALAVQLGFVGPAYFANQPSHRQHETSSCSAVAGHAGDTLAGCPIVQVVGGSWQQLNAGDGSQTGDNAGTSAVCGDDNAGKEEAAVDSIIKEIRQDSQELASSILKNVQQTCSKGLGNPKKYPPLTVTHAPARPLWADHSDQEEQDYEESDIENEHEYLAQEAIAAVAASAASIIEEIRQESHVLASSTLKNVQQTCSKGLGNPKKFPHLAVIHAPAGLQWADLSDQEEQNYEEYDIENEYEHLAPETSAAIAASAAREATEYAAHGHGLGNPKKKPWEAVAEVFDASQAAATGASEEATTKVVSVGTNLLSGSDGTLGLGNPKKKPLEAVEEVLDDASQPAATGASEEAAAKVVSTGTNLLASGSAALGLGTPKKNPIEAVAEVFENASQAAATGTSEEAAAKIDSDGTKLLAGGDATLGLETKKKPLEVVGGEKSHKKKKKRGSKIQVLLELSACEEGHKVEKAREKQIGCEEYEAEEAMTQLAEVQLCTYNALISACEKRHKAKAMSLFVEMQQSDLNCFSLISACEKGNKEKPWKLLTAMRLRTYGALIRACDKSEKGKFDEAMAVVAEKQRGDWSSIRGLIKACQEKGGKAWELFAEMQKRDEVVLVELMQ